MTTHLTHRKGPTAYLVIVLYTEVFFTYAASPGEVRSFLVHDHVNKILYDTGCPDGGA